MNPFRSIATLVANAASPKLVLAVAISSAVTGGVAGPLAYQAFHARDVQQQAQVDQRQQQQQQRKDEAVGNKELAEGTTTTTIPPTTSIPTTTTTVPAPTTTTTVPSPTTTEPPLVTAPPSSPTTTVPSNPIPILVSVSPDHSPAEDMSGTQVSGQVYVFAATAANATVQYSVDGAAPSPNLEPLDTAPLDAGAHTVQAVVTGADDTTTTQSVSFTVVH